MKLDSLTPSFIFLEQFNVLDVEGPDAASFLHRLSTNHITNLDLRDACLTTFLDQKGRLVALAYVFRPDQNKLQIITPYASSKSLAEWLDQYLFTEEVTLSDNSDRHALAWVIGNHQQSWIKGPDFHFQASTAPSSLTLVDKGQAKAFGDELTAQNLKELSHAEFASLRIAGRVPYSANEINSNHNPLQLGLGESIHWAKGCYIGQEVISRLESKEKAASTLFAGKVASTELPKLEQGEGIHGEPGAAGVLTSISPIDINHEANVLVVLKRAHTFTHGITELSKVGIDSERQHD
jgi:folate-binding protein YgfZ